MRNRESAMQPGNRGRTFALACILTATALAATGCGSPFGRPQKQKPGSERVVSGTLKVSGSGTAMPLLKILATDFNKVHPGVRLLFLPGVHSGGGIKGAASGSLDMGAISRPLKPEEKRLGLSTYFLSDDALAVAVHPSVSISGISSAQVRQIYAGKVTNWKQLGGPDMDIAVLDRNEDESAKIIIRKYVLGPRLKVSSEAARLYYEGDMVDGLASTPGAIGYFSYGFAKSQNVKVRILALDGVTPSVRHVADGSYRMTRGLGIVLPKEPPPAARLFEQYATSPRAAAYMSRFGFAPHKR